MAAARKVSAATRSTRRPAAECIAASLPIVVVFPTPFTPVTRITQGRVDGSGAGGAASMSPSAVSRAFRTASGGASLGSRSRIVWSSVALVRTPTSAPTRTSSSSPRTTSRGRGPRPRTASICAVRRWRVAARPRRICSPGRTSVPIPGTTSGAGGLPRPRRLIANPTPAAAAATAPAAATSSQASIAAARSGGFVQAHGDDLGDARLLHGDPVERVGHLHRSPVVRDEHELRALRHLGDERVEATDVGLVEGRIHLVEEAERCRPDEKQREDESRCRERLLAAREQAQRLQLLAGQCHDDLDALLAALLGLGHLQPRRTSREELREHLGQSRVRGLEGLLEATPRRARELADGLPEVLQGTLEVGTLRRQELVPAADLLQLRQRRRVDVAEPDEPRP